MNSIENQNKELWLKHEDLNRLMIEDTVGYSKKNLLKYPYYETTKTYQGITYTDNGDGTVTANGTPTIDAGFNFFHRLGTRLTLKAGTYIYNGCPKGGSESTYFMDIIKIHADNTYDSIAIDIGEGATFTLEEDSELALSIIVMAGTTVTNLTFYPMIRPAHIKDDTYEPYNGRNLSEELAMVKSAVGFSKKNLLKLSGDIGQSITHAEVGYETTKIDQNIYKLNGTSVGNDAYCEIGYKFGYGTNPQSTPFANFDGGNYILSVEVEGTINNTNENAVMLFLQTDTVNIGLNINKSIPTYTVINNLKTINRCYIRTLGLVTLENYTVKIMLRHANINDSTFEPYTYSALDYISDINNNIGYGASKYKRLNQTLGESSNHKPWLELKAQWETFENSVSYNGFIYVGSMFHYVGFRIWDNYGAFIVYNYAENGIYHVYNTNGTWKWGKISTTYTTF